MLRDNRFLGVIYCVNFFYVGCGNLKGLCSFWDTGGYYILITFALHNKTCDIE